MINVNDTLYEITFNTEHLSVNTILPNLHSYIHNSLDMNITSDKQYNGSLTLTLTKDAMANVFCITRSDIDNGLKNDNVMALVDNNREDFTIFTTDDEISVTFDIPKGSRNATLVNQFVGMAVSPLVYFKGIPQTGTYKAGQDAIFNGTLVDACGRHLGEETVYFTAEQLNVAKKIISDNKGKFSINFTIPENIEHGNYTSKFEMYESPYISNPISGVGTLYLDVTANIDPPLKQFKSGIAAQDVKCENNLQLVIKAEDGSPACVKPVTASILIERGWAKEVVANNSKTTHMELKAYGFVCCGIDGDLLKGNLSSSAGPISDANVAISVNGIMMGYAKTYPDGCFQFSQWNDSKLSEQTNKFLANEKNSGSFGPYNLTFSAIYAGDGNNHYPVGANATSSMYLMAIPLPPPQFEATVTPSQVNVTQGSSSNIQISVRPMIEQWDVTHMNLYLERLLCGISYQVAQASDNNTSSTTHPAIFNVSLNATTYSPEGTYFIGMVQNGTNTLVEKNIGTFTLNVVKMR